MISNYSESKYELVSYFMVFRFLKKSVVAKRKVQERGKKGVY